MALFGISIRHGLNPEAAPTAGSKTPTRDMLTQHWRQVLRVALLNIGFGVAFYTVLVYAVTNVELMHRGVRCTGLAFAYNLSVGAFGGPDPDGSDMADRLPQTLGRPGLLDGRRGSDFSDHAVHFGGRGSRHTGLIARTSPSSPHSGNMGAPATSNDA